MREKMLFGGLNREMDTPKTGLQGVGTANTDPHKDFVIGTDGLSKSFGETVALRGLNLRVPRNSIFGFLGPNGAGKTTTLMILATLLEPTGGDAFVGGLSVRKDPRGVRRLLGYIPDFFGVYEKMTVREYLLSLIHI